MNLLQNIDWNILNFIHNNLTSGVMDKVMPFVSLLGNKGAIWLIVACIFIFIPKFRKYGIMMAIAFLLEYICGNLVLKNIICRQRPCWINQDIRLLIPVPQDYSFPSGHTLSSTIGAIFVYLANKKCGYFAIALAILIAFSRMYMYVHFPSDILAGLIIGVVISFFTYKICKYAVYKRNQKGI